LRVRVPYDSGEEGLRIHGVPEAVNEAQKFEHLESDVDRVRRAAMVRTRQPGQGIFKSVLPEDLDWQPFPAFPPSVRLAVVVGQPSESGLYVIRVKVPSGVKLMPHRHPEDRIYTVMSGVFYIGLGDRFDGDEVAAYPPSSVIVLPGNTYHFHWARSGEYVTQVTAIGPLGLEYLDPGDDPREHRHEHANRGDRDA
jgi:quercetin dioxygenase-like cupin family protein